MLLDESFQSLQALGITSQPSAILFAADGTPITGWLGAFPENEAPELAANSQAG
ncbi:MAG: hypothetical protein QMC04_05010 [Ilumatobacter sp.]|jgi:hypothetical protein